MGMQHNNVSIESRINHMASHNLHFASGGITIMAWFKTNDPTPPVSLALMDMRGNDGGYRLINQASGVLRYQFRYFDGAVNANDNTNSLANISTNTVQHFVAVHDFGVNVKLYFNGVIDTTKATSETMLIDGTQNINVNGVGGNQSLVTRALADVRIYNRVLTSDEIKIIYQTQGSALLYNPELWLPLDDYPKNHIFDGSEVFRDITGGLDFSIRSPGENPEAFPFPLKAHNQRRVHDVTYT